MSNRQEEKWLSDLQQKLQQFETNPPAGAWEAINQRMEGEQAPSAATRGVTSATKIVAGLSLIISIALIFLFTRTPTPIPLETSDKLETLSPEKVIPISRQTGNNVKTTSNNNIKELPIKKEVIVSSKTNVSSTPTTIEDIKETKAVLPQVLPTKMEIAITTPDTIGKIVPKPGSFYERMRTDSTLKKQQLFK